MSGFEVALAELPVARAEAVRVHEALQDAVSGVERSVTSLLSGGWRGAAAEAYAAAFEQWHEGAEQVLRALDAMTVLLADTESTYTVSDMSQSAAFGRIGGEL